MEKEEEEEEEEEEIPTTQYLLAIARYVACSTIESNVCWIDRSNETREAKLDGGVVQHTAVVKAWAWRCMSCVAGTIMRNGVGKQQKQARPTGIWQQPGDEAATPYASTSVTSSCCMHVDVAKLHPAAAGARARGGH
jgi:hypothetical protein